LQYLDSNPKLNEAIAPQSSMLLPMLNAHHLPFLPLFHLTFSAQPMLTPRNKDSSIAAGRALRPYDVSLI